MIHVLLKSTFLLLIINSNYLTEIDESIQYSFFKQWGIVALLGSNSFSLPVRMNEMAVCLPSFSFKWHAIREIIIPFIETLLMPMQPIELSDLWSFLILSSHCKWFFYIWIFLLGDRIKIILPAWFPGAVFKL